MFPIRKILCPTDFSASAENAFLVASSLARDQGARLEVLYVEVPIPYGEMGIPITPEELGGNLKEKLWESFRALTKSDPQMRNLRVNTHLAEGDPATEIIRAAKETDCDLIVMGTHGRTGLARILMGSVAEHVVRKAHCPVLTVKALARPASATSETCTREPQEAGTTN